MLGTPSVLHAGILYVLFSPPMYDLPVFWVLGLRLPFCRSRTLHRPSVLGGCWCMILLSCSWWGSFYESRFGYQKGWPWNSRDKELILQWQSRKKVLRYGSVSLYLLSVLQLWEGGLSPLNPLSFSLCVLFVFPLFLFVLCMLAVLLVLFSCFGLLVTLFQDITELK